ncbi:hypothetical protein FNJ87_08380 [Nonlabens mediterrranea]|uniref:Chemotaxis methyl-accepting receptor HlyB-like 4HB MCP domain-containing protein n=1 Tax=Nonlabens mediterrranea TaxID=1419947 RepID=A0ABS0A647_9FLAO|nr:hypothetical protein [Nonlabens mediterrranea]
MFKALTTSGRINITLGLLAVFLLILGTNRLDKRHFETAQSVVTSIYNDRVVAQDYIYKMNNLIHEKQHHYMQPSYTTNLNINKELDILINLFAGTELTANEDKTFQTFITNYELLKKKEETYFKKINEQSKLSSTGNSIYLIPFYEESEVLKSDLNNLAFIQVTESKNIIGIAQKSLNNNQLISSMEIYSLLVIGIIILVIIFYRIEKSKVVKDDLPS